MFLGIAGRRGKTFFCPDGRGKDSLSVFKGYELRELYPVPELRTMGDVDVLVMRIWSGRQKFYVDSAIRKRKADAVWALKKDNFSYEVHRRLAFGSYWNDVDYEGYFATAFDRLTTGEGSRRYFTPEDHFIFFVLSSGKTPEQYRSRDPDGDGSGAFS